MLQKLWSSTLFINSILLVSLMYAEQAPENLIQSISIGKHVVKIIINKEFKKAWLRDDFFARYGQSIDLQSMPFSIVTLPFILNVYPIVWISGKDYAIDSMDEDTYHSLEKIKTIFQKMYPSTSFSGRLIPKELVRNRPSVPLLNEKTHIAVLYSSGLDSTAASFQHYDKHQLLITSQGQGDLPTRMPALWEKRKKQLIKYAHDYGHESAFASSNYTEFLNWDVLESVSKELTSWRVDTTEGLGLFGVAAPILFSRGYTKLLIGSSFTWDYPFPSAANPLVDDTLKVAGVLSLKHEHFDLSRFDKVKLIVDLVKTKNLKIPYMRVCDAKLSEGNCCRDCAKCQTVMNALFALGEKLGPYGFKITPAEIKQRTEEYFGRRQGYWTCWNFCDMQQKLKALPEIPKNAEWLLAQGDFMQHAGYHMAGAKSRIDWHTFKDLAPAALAIPSTIPPCMCDNDKERKKQERRNKSYGKLTQQKQLRAALRSKVTQEATVSPLKDRAQESSKPVSTGPTLAQQAPTLAPVSSALQRYSSQERRTIALLAKATQASLKPVTIEGSSKQVQH